jgi:poly-gamma-glutamate capsule biosynthesis protein CapA/YwtB (metallophosphatase superfamily)
MEVKVMKIKSKRISKVTVFICIILWLMALHPWGMSAEDKEITIAAVGDCLIFNKVSFYKDPEFLQMVEILRQADCTYGNCETTFFKPEDGFPAYKDFDPNVFCYPWGADEIKWFGIDLMSVANNHIMDFDYAGMFSTFEHLDRVGIIYAGAGKDLQQASRPGYFETDKGPVSLVSCSSWIPEKNHQASLSSDYMRGKPGLNPLNVDWMVQLDEEKFARMKKIRDDIGKDLGFTPPKEEEGKEITELDIAGKKFIKGNKVDILISANKNDLERIKESIKIAKRNSRLVIVSQHEHIGTRKAEGEGPTKFQEDFARSCIDAGADMYVGTGAHQLWGIEIYKGKPIFYCLGNFFFQSPIRIFSPEAYQRVGLPLDTKDPTLYEEKFDQYFTEVPVWDSVVPVVTFDGQGKVKEIKLYPIYLLGDKRIYLRGTPRLAQPGKAKAIIDELDKLSKPYNTTITFKKGVGNIVL